MSLCSNGIGAFLFPNLGRVQELHGKPTSATPNVIFPPFSENPIRQLDVSLQQKHFNCTVSLKVRFFSYGSFSIKAKTGLSMKLKVITIFSVTSRTNCRYHYTLHGALTNGRYREKSEGTTNIATQHCMLIIGEGGAPPSLAVDNAQSYQSKAALNIKTKQPGLHTRPVCRSNGEQCIEYRLGPVVGINQTNNYIIELFLNIP